MSLLASLPVAIPFLPFYTRYAIFRRSAFITAPRPLRSWSIGGRKWRSGDDLSTGHSSTWSMANGRSRIAGTRSWMVIVQGAINFSFALSTGDCQPEGTRSKLNEEWNGLLVVTVRRRCNLWWDFDGCRETFSRRESVFYRVQVSEYNVCGCSVQSGDEDTNLSYRGVSVWNFWMLLKLWQRQDCEIRDGYSDKWWL